MKPRKDITGAQAKQLARLALVADLERTRIVGQVYATVIPRFVPGRREDHVIIERDGRMRSMLPSGHHVCRMVSVARRERKVAA